MKHLLPIALSVLLPALFATPGSATDPPHDFSMSVECSSCHTGHSAPGGEITLAAGNANLCQSCHVLGGQASAFALTEAEQSLPGPVLPAGVAPSGTSHRWDSGPAGHVKADPANLSTGTVRPGGDFDGRVSDTYVITITQAGGVGTAEFSWTSSLGGGGGAPTTSTVRDEFNAFSYGNNDGTENWTTNWIEDDDRGGGANGGNFRVVSDANCTSSNCLRIEVDRTNDDIYREADLSGATSATLTYDYVHDNNDGRLRVEVSPNGGGSWSTLTTYDLGSSGSGSESFDLTSYVASNTRIRFLVTNNNNGRIWIDDVQIEFDTGGGGGGGGSSSGSGVTGVDVPIEKGITLTFIDGTAAPSFEVDDTWNLYVMTDISPPSDPEMAARLEDGNIMCSTCHNQHSQELAPFDPDAPAYGGKGTGYGRHFQRIDNDANQMCADCHSARYVSTSAEGSHPVGIGGAAYCTVCHDVHDPNPLPDPPPIMPSSPHVMQCTTCHQLHYSPATDGTLRYVQDTNAQCTYCHRLADTYTPAPHFDPFIGVLWPGGQYGSTFPANSDASERGFCTNCHNPHGWPDDALPDQDYPLLLLDWEENLCFTCHDGSPSDVPDVKADFDKASSHPLALYSGVHDSLEAARVDDPDRHVECADCHNTHQAKATVSLPGPSAAPRPASGPLEEIRGVNLGGAEVDPASYEYELCFRCHADSTGKPAAPTPRQFPQTDVRLEFNGSGVSFHSVAVTGTINANVPSLTGGWTVNSMLACTSCHNSNSGPGNGGSGANGVHGSIYPNILERRYVTADNTQYDPDNYALCFKCHSESVLRDNGVSFELHDKHFRGAKAPCSTCHDPHGSAGQKFLINFNTDVVSPDRNGRLEHIAPEDSGDGKGYCYLECHNKRHDPKDYDPNY